jgi:hypothetical protein
LARHLHKRYARLRRIFDMLSPSIFERWLNRRLQSRIDAHVGGYFSRSNARTEKLIGRSLDDMDYLTVTE